MGNGFFHWCFRESLRIGNTGAGETPRKGFESVQFETGKGKPALSRRPQVGGDSRHVRHLQRRGTCSGRKWSENELFVGSIEVGVNVSFKPSEPAVSHTV